MTIKPKITQLEGNTWPVYIGPQAQQTFDDIGTVTITLNNGVIVQFKNAVYHYTIEQIADDALKRYRKTEKECDRL